MGLFSKIANLLGNKQRRPQDFDQSSSLQETPSGWELPPLSSREAQAVLSQSEFAALEASPEEGERINPHQPGSREHRLWADNFDAVQRSLGKKR